MNNFYDKFVYCVRIVFGGFCEHFGCFEFVKLGWLEMSGNLFHYFCMYVSNITDWSVCVKQTGLFVSNTNSLWTKNNRL